MFDEHLSPSLYLGRADDWHRPGGGVCCTPGIADAPSPAAPCPDTDVRSTTASEVGPAVERRISMKRHWPAGPTTASSKRVAGPHVFGLTAAPNGSPHPTSTRAKLASTTTTTPSATSSPMNKATTTISCRRGEFLHRAAAVPRGASSRGDGSGGTRRAVRLRPTGK